ncbi:hypothetical protein F5Y15DRAFT_296714 [Xylariaceae sp. FL0016]|nr:hypothetical protein F5Y15DRAFT_296714 [Xylariaceae sp. FL0016]
MLPQSLIQVLCIIAAFYLSCMSRMATYRSRRCQQQPLDEPHFFPSHPHDKRRYCSYREPTRKDGGSKRSDPLPVQAQEHDRDADRRGQSSERVWSCPGRGAEGLQSAHLLKRLGSGVQKAVESQVCGLSPESSKHKHRLYTITPPNGVLF